jgi:type IV pilus assembly protein PilB
MMTLTKTRPRLGEILVTSGVITEDDLNTALERQKTTFRRLGEILLEAKMASEDDIIEAHAIQNDIPYVRLGEFTIVNDAIDTIPEPVARTYNVIPFSVTSDRLAVAISNPMDLEALDAIQRISRRRVEPVLAAESRIRTALDKLYGAEDGQDILASIKKAVDDDFDTDVDDSSVTTVEAERRLSEDAPVVKTVNLVIQEAIRQHASDVHFEPRAGGMEIRYRIDGALQHIRNLPRRIQSAVTSRLKIMAEIDIAEKRLPQDGRISIKMLNREFDLRASTFPVQHGERVVLRILDKQARQFSLDNLGFTGSELKRFESLITKPHGMILVTGPTGSGKTTTLYSALTHIQSVETNIMTCEDPVEYELNGINQSAVNSKAGLTFAMQLRSILRQDPDIVLVGEVRDAETAKIAFQAAMTGHLVFSTLLCNDAPAAITRLLDMGVEPFLVSSSVIGVLAQRLIRLLCPKCKAAYEPTEEDLALLKSANIPDKAVFYKHVGCRQCNMRGYSGRQAVVELMTVNDEIRHMIAHDPSADVVRQAAYRNGMASMRSHAAEAVLAGLTTFDEIRKKVFVEESVSHEA